MTALKGTLSLAVAEFLKIFSKTNKRLILWVIELQGKWNLPLLGVFFVQVRALLGKKRTLKFDIETLWVDLDEAWPLTFQFSQAFSCNRSSPSTCSKRSVSLCLKNLRVALQEAEPPWTYPHHLLLFFHLELDLNPGRPQEVSYKKTHEKEPNAPKE